ncbi:kinase-like domain-containing protein [Pilobolus umbonatus]|nr:kinase-like domain-containing protein [Pilobolus umbonatus]
MFQPEVLINAYIDRHSIQLLSILGKGAFGVVYLGQYVHSNKYCAVKCLEDNAFSDNEINIHSILSGHSNILSLEKVVKEHGLLFIVMEYATHGDLFSVITNPQISHTIFGNSRVIRHLFLQILDSVQHCHHNLVAHRDLKPENILLLSNHRIKLSDFGLATCQLTSTQFNCGSSFYFSPECQGISIDSNTVEASKSVLPYDAFSNDIWSLGIILFNLVSGRNPWKQSNLEDKEFVKYVRKPRQFFRRILPTISKSLNRILLRIFCLDPSKRIKLPELRSMIVRCKSFGMDNMLSNNILDTPPPSIPHSNIDMICTASFEGAMLAYIGDYTDEDLAPPTNQISSTLNADTSLYSYTSESSYYDEYTLIDHFPPTPTDTNNIMANNSSYTNNTYY